MAWPRSSPGQGQAAGRTCAPSASRAAVVTEVASFFAYDPAFPGGVHVAAADLNRIVPAVLPGFLSRLTLAILRPPEPHDEAGVQHGTVAADVVRKALRADGRADDLILPREEVGAGAEVGRVAICAEETTIVTLFRPPVARDVPVSAGRAPLARAGWLQSTVRAAPAPSPTCKSATVRRNRAQHRKLRHMMNPTGAQGPIGRSA